MSIPLKKTLAGWAIAAALVAACGSDGAPSSSEAGGGVPTEPRTGGTLIYLDTGEGDNLDPAVVGGILSAQGSYPLAVFDVLLYEKAGTGEVVPRIAEALDSEDGITWTLTVRDGVEFSDGTVLDAEAVRFNWERIGEPDRASPSSSAAQSIKSMEVLDDLTLEVVLAQPNGQFPRMVAQSLPFVGSPTAIEAAGEAFGSNPVGAGPFVLESWTPGSEARFVRNPSYWDSPRPYVDELVMRVVDHGDQRYNTLVTGGADMLGVESEYAMLVGAEGDGLEVSEVSASGGFALPLNVTTAPFDDLTARRAFTAAIDREGLIESVLDGGLDPFASIFADESPFFDPAIEWPTYDPDLAQELIDEYVANTGGPLQFSLLLATGFEPYGEYLQTQLNTFDNLEMAVEYLAPAAFFERLGNQAFQASISVPSFPDPEPVVFDIYGTGEPRNFGGFSDPAMDRALEAGRASLEQADRVEPYRTMQEIAVEEVPHVWLAEYAYHQIHRPEVRGLGWAGGGVTLWWGVWLDQ